MKKIALMFAGQGTQYPGMFLDICKAYESAAEVIYQADKVLERKISEIIFRGSVEQLDETKNTQPGIFATEIAALRVLVNAGINPTMTMGFSLGEWTAICAAGVLSYEQTLPIVEKRAECMQQAVPLGNGGMAVVICKDIEEVESMCKQVTGVSPSNYNCPGQVTVAGTMEGIDSLLDIAKSNGIVAKKLAISVPSHCSMMRPAALCLQSYIENIPFLTPTYPIVMNCDAQAHMDAEQIKHNVIRQLTEPVRFEESVKMAITMGIDTFIELGPGHVLSGLVNKTAKNVGAKPTLLQVNDVKTLRATIETVA